MGHGAVGLLVGLRVLGLEVGWPVGIREGCDVGEIVGPNVGLLVGTPIAASL